MRISRIVAGIVGLVATLLAFGLAIAVLVGWSEFLEWFPRSNVPWLPRMGGMWGVPGRGLGVLVVGLVLVALLLAVPLVLLYGFVSGANTGAPTGPDDAASEDARSDADASDDTVSGETTPDTASDDTAIQILRERYANGDIDDEEYERRRRRLEG